MLISGLPRIPRIHRGVTETQHMKSLCISSFCFFRFWLCSLRQHGLTRDLGSTSCRDLGRQARHFKALCEWKVTLDSILSIARSTLRRTQTVGSCKARSYGRPSLRRSTTPCTVKLGSAGSPCQARSAGLEPFTMASARPAMHHRHPLRARPPEGRLLGF
ncbi:hypothetical protein Cob_v001558 [Colletotrichum orbiculare MAFF 240422]|uniref:Uncharacterized protein n=1 Tax=Colletotrichum orbiculare (strain 104-T / ATCC 96160 / CBS 514.97 / LARS 414 / MAFF 240422) TaxID=1213857 RepID=A0A484G6E5_COLOR|nr:hypothetical protein Cob_v001558 [Colletotrichum orbiculare MAFF 240422]